MTCMNFAPSGLPQEARVEAEGRSKEREGEECNAMTTTLHNHPHPFTYFQTLTSNHTERASTRLLTGQTTSNSLPNSQRTAPRSHDELDYSISHWPHKFRRSCTCPTCCHHSHCIQWPSSLWRHPSAHWWHDLRFLSVDDSFPSPLRLSAMDSTGGRQSVNRVGGH